MKKARRSALFFLALLAVFQGGACADFDIRGQFSFWMAAHDRPASEGALGLRYIPAFSLMKDFGRGLFIDAEASVSAYGNAQGRSFSEIRTSGNVKPYRFWVRIAAPRFEARLGLQKINFGSAMLLRPLMWFDRIDPNDPLQLTDGVYGLLLKYTFSSNANIWLWGLYGNDELKGWESVPSRRTSPEFGGRVQVPALSGEMALTYHHRRLDTSKSLTLFPPGERDDPPEDRLGFDGKWDIGPGVWIEAVFTRQGYTLDSLKYQKTVNLGLDYTFSIGSGFHVLAEHLIMDASAGAWRSGRTSAFTALSLDYPLGLLDRIRGVAFYNWTSGDWYRLVTWQRTYDKWSIYVIGFWNPDRYQIYAIRQESSLFAGKGFQVIVAFNH